MAFPLPVRGRLSAVAFLSVGGARGLVPSLLVGCISGYYTLPGGGMSTDIEKMTACYLSGPCRWIRSSQTAPMTMDPKNIPPHIAQP